MPAFYSLRPLAVRPKKPSNWEAVNLAFQLTFDLAVYLLLGHKSLFYLLVGTLLGTFNHPPTHLPTHLSDWEAVNLAFQLTFDLAIYLLLSWKSLFYLLVGTLLARFNHPPTHPP